MKHVLVGMLLTVTIIGAVAPKRHTPHASSEGRSGRDGDVLMPAALAPEPIPSQDATEAPKLSLNAAREAPARALDELVLYYTHRRGTLDGVLDLLRDISGLRIVVDSRVRDSVPVEGTITFEAHGVLLRDALASLCSAYGVRWTLTDEAIVVLTSCSDMLLQGTDLFGRQYTFSSDDRDPDRY